MVFKYISLHFSMTKNDQTFDLANSLTTNKFLCGVLKLRGKVPNPKNVQSRLFLCCDFCQDSYVNSTKMPALCEIVFKPNGTINTSFSNITWLHILRPNIASVRLYLCTEEGTLFSLEEGDLRCSLLFVHSP